MIRDRKRTENGYCDFEKKVIAVPPPCLVVAGKVDVGVVLGQRELAIGAVGRDLLGVEFGACIVSCGCETWK